MRFLILVAMTFFSFYAKAQNNLNEAISLLENQLDFVKIVNSHKLLKSPDSLLIKRFARCSNFESTFPLANLNFDNIKISRSIKMKSSRWKGPVVIKLQEWEFENQRAASTFYRILESVPHHHVQDLVNKGGIQWWMVNHKIYVLTSNAYFATYHYDKIIKVIKN